MGSSPSIYKFAEGAEVLVPLDLTLAGDTGTSV